MDDSIIKELGATFLVGAFAILSVEFILWRLFQTDLTSLLFGTGSTRNDTPRRNEDPESLPGVRIGAFVAVAFCVGIVTEGVASRVTEIGHIPPVSELSRKRLLFDTLLDDETVDSVLLRNLPDFALPRDLETYCPTPLARELGIQKAFFRFLRHDSMLGREMDFRLSSPCRDSYRGFRFRTKKDMEKWDDAFRSLYFFAQNFTFRTDNYYGELKRIRVRNEFSRSIFTIVALDLLFVFLAGAAHCLWRAVERLRSRIGRSRIPQHGAGASAPRDGPCPGDSEGKTASGTGKCPAEGSDTREGSGAQGPVEASLLVRVFRIVRERPHQSFAPREFAGVTIVFLAILLMSGVAFVQETEEMNRRVYGYLASFLVAQGDSAIAE